MKQLLAITMFTLLSVAGLRAQEYKIAEIENNKDARLTLDAFTGELPDRRIQW